MATKHIADAEDDFYVINITPDFCRVGKSIVAFDIYHIHTPEECDYARKVFARGRKVLMQSSVIKGVVGDAGAGVTSGTSLGAGDSKIIQGAPTVITEGRSTARHLDFALMNGPGNCGPYNCLGQVHTMPGSPPMTWKETLASKAGTLAGIGEGLFGIANETVMFLGDDVFQLGDILTSGYYHDSAFMQEVWARQQMRGEAMVQTVLHPLDTAQAIGESWKEKKEQADQLRAAGDYFNAARVDGSLGVEMLDTALIVGSTKKGGLGGVLVKPKARKKPNKPRKPKTYENKIDNPDGSTTYTLKNRDDGSLFDVTYTKDGYPDLSNYKYDGTLGKPEVPIDKITGENGIDFKNANIEAGFGDSTYSHQKAGDYIWHHDAITGNMQLIHGDIHRSVPHTGTASAAKNGTL
jgi:hypothetical protein